MGCRMALITKTILKKKKKEKISAKLKYLDLWSFCIDSNTGYAGQPKTKLKKQ